MTATDWLDGPKLVDWLESTGILTDVRAQMGKNLETSITRWREGAAANYYTADRILCRLGVCIGELPDSFYRDMPEGFKKSGLALDKVRAIQRLARSGESLRGIARTVGVDPKTARYYARKVRV